MINILIQLKWSRDIWENECCLMVFPRNALASWPGNPWNSIHLWPTWRKVNGARYLGRAEGEGGEPWRGKNGESEKKSRSESGFLHFWCRRRDSNPHERSSPPPQDGVSTRFHHFGRMFSPQRQRKHSAAKPQPKYSYWTQMNADKYRSFLKKETETERYFYSKAKPRSRRLILTPRQSQKSPLRPPFLKGGWGGFQRRVSNPNMPNKI